MKDWLIAELKSKYGVRIDIGKKWIEDKQLLPLLDGLDEVKPEHQAFCVTAINRWLGSDDRPSDLVVCSRREEYEIYQTQLQLNGAICLKDLTNEQIQDYSNRVNQPQLWHMVQLDAALLELVRKPLFLSITILACGEIALEQWQEATSTQARLALLLDAYVIRMLHTELKSSSYKKGKPPTAEQTRRWLACLAWQLQNESETEFLIEKMQPFWLQSKRQRGAYMLILGLIVVPVGGMSFGLIAVLIGEPIEQVKEVVPWDEERRELGNQYPVLKQVRKELGKHSLLGLIFGLTAMLSVVSKTEITTRTRPNQGIISSAKNSLILLAAYFSCN